MNRYSLSNTLLSLVLLYAIPSKSIAFENKNIASNTADYFGFTVGHQAEIFAPGIISTEHAELSATFSQNGDDFFYAMSNHLYDHYVIVHKERKNGIWQAPKIASFSGQYMDADPMLSPDGKRLYFISKRPHNSENKERKDYDIWYSEKANGSWGEPINVGIKVNTNQSEYYISVTKDYTLYYSANYEDDSKNSYLYKAALVNGEYQVSLLPKVVNGDSGGIDPYITPNEDMLLFTADRVGGFGGKDLYASFNIDGKWTKAINMGDKINTNFREYCPSMSPDGKYLFFTSGRFTPFRTGKRANYQQFVNKLHSIDNQFGNIYWIKSDFLLELKKQAIN